MMKLTFIGEAVEELDLATMRLKDRRVLMRAVTRSSELVRRQAMLNTQTVFANPTGHLARSIMVHANESTLSADIGPHVIYGRIQELGGTIRPVHAKMLAIPIGTMKGYARPTRLHIRRINGSFSCSTTPGAQYILKDFVIIKPHPYLVPARRQAGQHRREFDRSPRRLRVMSELRQARRFPGRIADGPEGVDRGATRKRGVPHRPLPLGAP